MYLNQIVLGAAVIGLTDSKQLHASVPQPLRGGHHVVLGLSIRDQDADLRDAGPGSRLRFEAVLQNVGQRQACGRDGGGSENQTETREWVEADKE